MSFKCEKKVKYVKTVLMTLFGYIYWLGIFLSDFDLALF